MFFLGRDKWWHDPIQTMQIDVAVSFNEVFCDGLMSVLGLEEERREPILPLKIDVTASCNELLCHVLVPVEGSAVEGGVPIPVLEVNDELVVFLTRIMDCEIGDPRTVFFPPEDLRSSFTCTSSCEACRSLSFSL